MARRPNWQESHPPACTCAECAEARAARRPSDRPGTTATTFSTELTLEEAGQGVARTVDLPDGRRLEIAIPSGVENGNRVHVAPDGDNGIHVYLSVSVRQHPFLRRDGPHLFTSVQVPEEDARHGTQVSVRGLSETLGLTVPPNTEDGQVFRLAGRGMPTVSQPGQRGDLYATLKVAPPARVPVTEPPKSRSGRIKTWAGVLVMVGFIGVISFYEFGDATRAWLCAAEGGQRLSPPVLTNAICDEPQDRAVQHQPSASVAVRVSSPTPAPTMAVNFDNLTPVPIPMFLAEYPTPISTTTVATAPTPTAKPTVGPTARPISAPSPTTIAFQPGILADIRNGSYLETIDPDAAQAVKSLPWVQDDIERSEERHLEDLLQIAVYNAAVFDALIGRPWVRDGFSKEEAEAFEDIVVIDQASSEHAATVAILPWVQDGLSEQEVLALSGIASVAFKSPSSLPTLFKLEWVHADISGQEAQVIEHIGSISFNRAKDVQKIVSMPFLETLEPADGPALMSLRQLAAFYPTMFDRVLAHETLAGGISDDWVPVVATLYGVSQFNAPLVEIILDPDRVTVEERHITLPLRGEVLLAIIRTSPGATRSMDLLEAAVRSGEDFVGVPFPTDYIGMVFEHTVVPGQAGTNFGTHIAVSPKFDVDDGSHSATHAGPVIAHEVAHYYWSGNAGWIDEGAADLMASISENHLTGSPIVATNEPCVYADSISDLEKLDPQPGSLEYRCNYSLGERLFLQLYRGLGAEAFQAPFRALYVESVESDEARVEDLRAAFRDNVPPVAVPATEKVISHWYDGGALFSFEWRDEGRVHNFNGLNGRLDAVYISLSRNGPKVAGFSAGSVKDQVWLGFEYSYRLARGSKTVLLEVLVYYEDGFISDQREVSIDASSSHIGGSLEMTIGPARPRMWKPGDYQVYVYQDGQRKVGQIAFSVTK